MIGAGERDRGSAPLEFLVIGIGVLVPVAYLALAATSVQAEVLAGTQAVREAARAFSTAVTVAEGRARATAAARLAFADHGIEVPQPGVAISCSGGPCLAPGSVVDVRLDWDAVLPWVPLLAADGSRPSIPVSARHVVPIDDYRGDPS